MLLVFLFQIVEFNGHRFRMTSYLVPMECQHCHLPLKLDALAKNEGFSCQSKSILNLLKKKKKKKKYL